MPSGTTNLTTLVASGLDSHTGGSPFGFSEAVNLLATTLDGAHTDVVTTITVASTTGFPTRGLITVDTETITYTGTTATTFAGATRGTGGTSAASHSGGATVANVPQAANHNDVAAAVAAAEQYITAVGNGGGIHNGNFNVWQRGTTFTTIADGAYSADRWKYENASAAAHTVSRSTDVPAVAGLIPHQNYSLLLDCTMVDTSLVAGDLCTIGQRIEGYDWLPYAQRQFTLSFWVKGTKTGIHCVSFRNSGNDRTYVAEYTINTTATWEYKTITVSASPSAGTWDYTTGIGLKVSWALNGLTVGGTFLTTANAWQTGNFLHTANQVNATDSTSNDFRIAMVQLDIGPYAFPFRSRPIAAELVLCQRYFEKSYAVGTTPGTAVEGGSVVFGGSDNNTAKNLLAPVRYRVEKRSTVTTVFYDNLGASAKISTWAAGGTVTNGVTPSYGEYAGAATGFNLLHNGAVASVQFHYTAAADL